MPIRTRIQHTFSIPGVAVALLAGCANQSPRGEHDHRAVPLAHEAAPAHYSLLLEDDAVRLVEFSIDPGERDEWHRHPHEAFYVLEGGTIRIELPSGESIEARFESGDVTSHGPWTHRVENIGTTRFRAIIFEAKSAN